MTEDSTRDLKSGLDSNSNRSTDAMREALKFIQQALGLFQSAIKCGEQWTPACQRARDQAILALKDITQALASPPQSAGVIDPYTAERCAEVAERAAQSDDEYMSKYPDEEYKFENRKHRATTIALAIRSLLSGSPPIEQGSTHCSPRRPCPHQPQTWTVNATPENGMTKDG